jgi:two-component system, OmpR family, heavy metal sensor histidine kinase CusS
MDGTSRAVQSPADSARELREKKRVLAALVVHDLRSPLSAIQGYLDLLREELAILNPEKSANATAYLDDATTLVGKALGLVATILDVDELEDGILHADRTPVRLLELIDRARAGNRAHLEVRQLRYELVCDPELTVDLDRDLFARVFENLLDNGARYAPRGGVLSVTAMQDETGLEIAIGNSGPPVPAAERETIFGRYFQIEARRAAARANRGLGLYFCKLAVEAHDGTIHVETRPGLGTVFVIKIPNR